MGTKQETVDFLLEQMHDAGTMRARKMFGEYAIYCDEKVVAFVCDDQLFIKRSAAEAALLDDCTLAPPYPGAKDYLRVSEERWDDPGWLSMAVRTTADVLPPPKPK